MKRIGLVLLLTIFCALIWLFFNSAVSNIEYSFTETGIGKYQDSIQPVKFALISDIHLRESAREEITAEEGTIDILQEFITSMNTEVKPDFIVQLGDLADGCMVNCTISAPQELILERLEKAKEFTRKNTDITWFDVIGNHEYKVIDKAKLGTAGEMDFSDVYTTINEDWSRLEDTWYYREINGYRFIFLNTAFPYPGNSHLIPPQEVEWLREQLASSNKPTFVFMHVPVSDGDASEYDFAVNQEKVVELLASDDSFVAGFFGHSHHADNWDGLRKQFDDGGNIYFHIPAPHEWMGDRSRHPWIIVTIEPDLNGFTVEVGSGVKRSKLSEFAYFLKERLVKKLARLNINLAL